MSNVLYEYQLPSNELSIEEENDSRREYAESIIARYSADELDYQLEEYKVSSLEELTEIIEMEIYEGIRE